MMLEAAARSDRLQAVVSEGAGIRSTREATMLPGANLLSNLPSAIQTAGLGLFSNEAVPANLVDLVDDIAPRPVMFVYSTHGGGERLSERYFDAAREPRRPGPSMRAATSEAKPRNRRCSSARS